MNAYYFARLKFRAVEQTTHNRLAYKAARGREIPGCRRVREAYSLLAEDGNAKIAVETIHITDWGTKMNDSERTPGEMIYEYTAHVTEIVEYGIPASVVFSGQTPPPPEGVRLDVSFEGPVTGSKLKGTVKGVDHIHVRADGRCQLHIHAEISTEDGKKIALAADGVAIPEKGSPVFQLRENVTLTTHYPEYSWLRTIQVWGLGTVDVSKGEIHIKGYVP